MKRRGSVVLVVALIIVIVLVAAGGIWYWKMYKPSTNNSQSQSATTVQTTSTYQNTDYGISFDYPNTWTVKFGDTAEGDYGLYTQYDPSAAPLVTVEMPTSSYPGTGFGGAYFNLSVDKQLSQSQCLALTSQPGPNDGGGMITIGGVVFNWTRAGSVAAGTDELTQNYSGYANGTCYEFNLGDRGGANINGVTGATMPSYANDISVLEGVLSSVKFTGSISLNATSTATSPATSATPAEIAACDSSIFANPTSNITISNAESHQIKNVVAAQAVAGNQIFLLVGTYDGNYNYSSLAIEKDTTSDIINDTLNLQTVANIPISPDPSVVEAYFMAGDGVVIYDLGYQYNDATTQYANETLVAVDTQTGKQLWTVEGPITASPTIVEGAVYVPTNYGLVKMDDASGKSLWQFADARSSALLTNGTVYTTNACGWACRNSSTSTLYAINDSNGALITNVIVPVWNVSQWAQCGGNIYFSSEAAPNVNASYRLDPATMKVTSLGSITD